MLAWDNITYASNRGGNEGKLQQADHLTPRRRLAPGQHGQQRARDDERRGAWRGQGYCYLRHAVTAALLWYRVWFDFTTSCVVTSQRFTEVRKCQHFQQW